MSMSATETALWVLCPPLSLPEGLGPPEPSFLMRAADQRGMLNSPVSLGQGFPMWEMGTLTSTSPSSCP